MNPDNADPASAFGKGEPGGGLIDASTVMPGMLSLPGADFARLATVDQLALLPAV